MEASRRIELLYTDLQSNCFHNEINTLDLKEYQDILRTGYEHDTRNNHIKTKQNAASVIAEHGEFEGNLDTDTTTERLEAASILAHAIAKCDPRDALLILSVSLSDLSFAGPILITEDGLQTEGQWYSVRTPTDIEKYFQTWIEATPSRRLEAIERVCT